MYYYLLSSIKRRVILELKDSFSRHPVYQKVVPAIQNKYSFEERPQFGIVIKGASVNKVALSADNFIGNIESRVMLAYVGEPVYPIEWVREDLSAVRDNNGQMPSLPGVYYIEILTAPDTPQTPGTFAIDPLLTVTDEAVLRFVSGIEREAQLQNIPVQGTVRLWKDHRTLLTEGTDYTVNYATGAISFLVHFPANSVLTGDYRFAAPSVGPVNFYWNTADFKSIPGVVLAFGKRAKVGDKVAVVVYPERTDTAFAYGGKFEHSLDLDVIATDPTQMEDIADLCIMYLWGEKKPVLEYEGIEIVDMSIGGEAEETYDETADTFYYTASISLQLRADWEMHVPLPLTISKATTETPEGKNGLIAQIGGLFYVTTPLIVGRNNDYERIT